MLQNYLKVTLRNLLKNKGYFSINLLGLALGTVCALLIFVMVRYEHSFDKFHAKADKIYRVITHGKDQEGKESLESGSHYSLVGALRTNFAEVKSTIVRNDGFEVQINVKDDLKGTEQKYIEENTGFVEPEFFEIFDFEIIQGEGKSALKNPNNALISETIAKKYFGNEAPIGKTIRRDGQTDFKVVGIFKDFPSNTDLPFKIMFSYATISQIEGKESLETWGGLWSQLETYMLLPKELTQSQVEARFPAFGKKYLDENTLKRRRYGLQPLSDIHFNSQTNNFANRTASIENLWALGLVAIFLIITACINFINLATAQAVKRSKEVGIRKVLGSSRLALVYQFFGETLIITLLAIVIASASAELLLPFLNQLMGLKIEKSFLWNGETALFLVCLLFVITLLSGFYPALVLSGFKPVLAIKNSITSNHAGGLNLRRGLVVLQFAISQILIIATIIATQQMDFFRSKDLGFNKDAILTVGLPKNDPARFETLKSELERLSEIEKVSLSFAPPSAGFNWTSGFRYTPHGDTDYAANMKMADTDYLNLYGLTLVAGRNFNRSDTLNEIVVNEALTQKLGFKTPQEALGQIIMMGRRNQSSREIVGVVKDFHVFSLHQSIMPVVIGSNRGAYNIAGIKLNMSNVKETLPKIEKIWTSVFPEYVYEYDFLDKQLGEFYLGEERQANLFKIFALIAIFIGCIGLYGLVSFMVTQKTKEIGVRKVLGASVNQIVFIFTKEFAKLLLIAFIIASPLVYYVMQGWLENFSYRIELGISVFLIAILVSALIATLTVGYKSFKAATVNPVKSLRTE
jgi:ABC-type antimicrobial peptide transport system permease subunit